MVSTRTGRSNSGFHPQSLTGHRIVHGIGPGVGNRLAKVGFEVAGEAVDPPGHLRGEVTGREAHRRDVVAGANGDPRGVRRHELQGRPNGVFHVHQGQHRAGIDETGVVPSLHGRAEDLDRIVRGSSAGERLVAHETRIPTGESVLVTKTLEDAPQCWRWMARLGYVSLTTGNVLNMYKSIAWELGLPTERSRATDYRAIRAEITRRVCEAKQLPNRSSTRCGGQRRCAGSGGRRAPALGVLSAAGREQAGVVLRVDDSADVQKEAELPMSRTAGSSDCRPPSAARAGRHGEG